MNEVPPPKKDEGGGAGWIMTFADLMSLLMCFFVLLLSFAELDIMKFKAIAGSMKLAFGVQREIKAIEVPKGTSIIAQEFSAGKPEPTVVNEIRQQTTDEDKQSLEFTDALVNEKDGSNPLDLKTGDTGRERVDPVDPAPAARKLSEALAREIEQGMIEIDTEGASIIIRIREQGSFPSGQSRFHPAFKPVVAKLRESLRDLPGQVTVAGHTDNIPIRTQRYRSNWDLSSARAVSVVHELLDGKRLDPARFVVEGHGDAHPLADNDTPANRARNRRVEIIIRQDPEQAFDDGQAEQLAALGATVEMPATVDPDAAAGAVTVDTAADVDNAVLDGDAAGGDATGDATGSEAAGDESPESLAEAILRPEAPASSGPFALPIPATVPAPEGAVEAVAPPIFPSRPASSKPSRLDLIRDGMRGQ